ncbi:MAG TPA: hypothetical protein VJ572_07350, partial [Azonexus sp.]|nr:hypothetical protein [Azonexus sp.]
MLAAHCRFKAGWLSARLGKHIGSFANLPEAPVSRPFLLIGQEALKQHIQKAPPLLGRRDAFRAKRQQALCLGGFE